MAATRLEAFSDGDYASSGDYSDSDATFSTHKKAIKLPVEKATKLEYDQLRDTWCISKIDVQMENVPFAAGAMRHAFKFGIIEPGAEGGMEFVAKRYWEKKKKAYLDSRKVKDYFSDVKMQAVAYDWAMKFNGANPPKKVSFLPAFLLYLHERPDAPFVACEPLIAGKYVKHNNNAGWVSSVDRNTPQAFSHYTYEASNKQLLIVDIQGVGDVYTDPQIHAVDKNMFGAGNLGKKGFAEFFSTHKCSSVCGALGLPARKKKKNYNSGTVMLMPEPDVPLAVSEMEATGFDITEEATVTEEEGVSEELQFVDGFLTIHHLAVDGFEGIDRHSLVRAKPAPFVTILKPNTKKPLLRTTPNRSTTKAAWDLDELAFRVAATDCLEFVVWDQHRLSKDAEIARATVTGNQLVLGALQSLSINASNGGTARCRIDATYTFEAVLGGRLRRRLSRREKGTRRRSKAKPSFPPPQLTQRRASKSSAETHGKAKEKVTNGPFTCAVCTLINEQGGATCEVCGSPRPRRATKSNQTPPKSKDVDSRLEWGPPAPGSEAMKAQVLEDLFATRQKQVLQNAAKPGKPRTVKKSSNEFFSSISYSYSFTSSYSYD